MTLDFKWPLAKMMYFIEQNVPSLAECRLANCWWLLGNLPVWRKLAPGHLIAAHLFGKIARYSPRFVPSLKSSPQNPLCGREGARGRGECAKVRETMSLCFSPEPRPSSVYTRPAVCRFSNGMVPWCCVDSQALSQGLKGLSGNSWEPGHLGWHKEAWGVPVLMRR